MAKRSWLEANDSPQVGMTSPPATATTSRRRGYDLLPGSLPPQPTAGEILSGSGTTYHASLPQTVSPTSEKQSQSLTSVEISRKVKACAACRKQKIRCHMVDGKPPCTRCKQRNLSCVLNKSLQMLMEENSQWHQGVVKDLELLYSGLQEAREHVALDPLPQLRSSSIRRGSDTMDPGVETMDERDSDRQSPSMPTAFEDTLPATAMSDPPREHVRSPVLPCSFATMQPQSSWPPRYAGESPEEPRSQSLGNAGPRDLITTGRISKEDGQRLFDLYTNELDHFVSGLGIRWQTLEGMRSRSPILTASVMAVAALHDPQSEHIYPICNQELRRLVAASLFDQRVNRDYLRALCLASHWLSDASWTLSGVAIRRATEVNLAGSYQRVIAEGSEDAADCLRLWYHLCLCDRNLSFVFSRESLVRDDPSVAGWNEFLKSTAARSQDNALVMMVGQHQILGSVRDLFGPDNGATIPVAYATQIAYYSQQLDQWLAVWLNVLRDAGATGAASPAVGNLHIKGAMVQYHFSKLYICSHVYRGLSPTAPIPEPLREAARSATTAAIESIQLCLTDPEVGASLRGMPTHIHAMLCFSSVFLLKVAVKRQDGFVEVDVARDLAARLVHRLRGMELSRWHPAGFIADMLERSTASYLSLQSTSTGKGKGKESSSGSGSGSGSGSAARVPGSMMEEASQRALGVFAGPGTSVMHQPILEVDEEGGGGSGSGRGIPGLSSSFGSPDVAFAPSSFFDFGAATQSGQDEDTPEFRRGSWS